MLWLWLVVALSQEVPEAPAEVPWSTIKPEGELPPPDPPPITCCPAHSWVAAPIEGAREALRYCWQGALARQPDRVWRSTLRIVVDNPSGVPTEVRSDGDPLPPCLLAVLESLRWEPLACDGTTIIVYPWLQEAARPARAR